MACCPQHDQGSCLSHGDRFPFASRSKWPPTHAWVRDNSLRYALVTTIPLLVCKWKWRVPTRRENWWSIPCWKCFESEEQIYSQLYLAVLRDFWFSREGVHVKYGPNCTGAHYRFFLRFDLTNALDGRTVSKPTVRG